MINVLPLLALILFVAISMGAIYLLFQLLINFQPTSNKIKTDLARLKTELTPWVSELVPWDENDEIELLSLNQINRTVKKGLVKTAKGVFTSIYHEPMIAFAYRRYPSSAENGILYARTSDYEFVYRIKPKEIQITINNQLIGKLKNDNLLYSARSNRLLAKINREEDELLLPIIVGQKEVASLVRPEKARTVNPRAFEFVQKLEKDEEAILLAVAIQEMVRKSTKF